jgi:S-adenosylmethionine synthetase
LDACIRVDPAAKVAMETACKSNVIVLMGETNITSEQVDWDKCARDTANQVGFTSTANGLDGNKCKIIKVIEAQDANIAAAVHGDRVKCEDDLGAGDQGIMFGYATDEWDQKTLHPYSHQLACEINEEMARLRHSGEVSWLRPDCKSQVVLEYKLNNGRLKPIRVFNVLISTQHSPDVDNKTIRTTLIDKVIKKVCPKELLIDTEYVINPSGCFDVGGPAADAGLTGRKIIVDSYGGWAPHGGGAYSGKDPTKVDRSAAYYARYVAKSLVHAKLAHRVLVQVSYAIGLADPLSIHVESYGTVKKGLSDEKLSEIVMNNFNFRPMNIIKELDLRRPIYQKTARFGHFGKNDPDFKWETPKKLKL